MLQLGFSTLADEDAAVIARDREAAEQAAAATKIQAVQRGKARRRQVPPTTATAATIVPAAEASNSLALALRLH